MNCFYKTLFMAVTAVLAPLYAMAIPGYDITIKVDDPQRVKVEFCQYSEVKQTVDFGGATSVTMEWPYNLSMRISATDGNILTGVKAAGEDQYVQRLLQSTLSFDRAELSDETVSVTSAALNRSVNVTVKTDEPQKLMMFNDNTYASPNRIDGFSATETHFSFDPQYELPIKFNGNTWRDHILKATCNGTDITNTSDSYYELTPADGDVYCFWFNEPDDTRYDVKFDYGRADHEIVTSVKVDGTELADFDGSDFQVAAGAKLQLYIDTDNYDITSVTRNGEPVRWSNKEIYLDAVRENITFAFDAHRLGKVKININVDHAVGVQVFNSSYNNHQPLTLVDGANEVEVDETVSPYLCIVSHPDWRLLSVGINNMPMDREYINYYKYTAGDEIDITTEQLVRDGSAYVYVDRPNNIYVYRANESLLSLESGFNLVPVSEYDSPFTIYHPAYATVNGRRMINEAEDDYIYYPDVAAGDVVKLYFEGAPAMHNINVDREGLVDRFTLLKDFTDDFLMMNTVSAEHGSRMTVVPAADATLTVTANGVDVPLSESCGLTGHHFDVTDDMMVKITENTGIGTVTGDASDAPADVYGLDGVLVKRAATAVDLRDLAPGFYIVGGRKILK